MVYQPIQHQLGWVYSIRSDASKPGVCQFDIEAAVFNGIDDIDIDTTLFT